MHHYHCILNHLKSLYFFVETARNNFALPQGKNPLNGARWAPEQVWNFGEQKNPLSLQGFETRNAQRVWQSLYA
jgi:hypothetical protein